MKKLMMAMTVVLATTTLVAATTRGAKRTKTRTSGAAISAEAADGETEVKERASVKIDIYPRLGRKALLSAPSLGDGTTLGSRCWTGPSRQWIVLECKYTTEAKCLDRLTFTWHVVLETKQALTKDKDAQKKMSPYSYFTTEVTYVNIPKGSHASSVCLHPSYYERYGDPCAVSVVVTDENGEIVAGKTESSQKVFTGKSADYKFWEDSEVMDKPWKEGLNWVERRQGLQERSKTIWALVNPDDYELVQQ